MSDSLPQNSLERKARNPKWRAKWAHRNKLLFDYLALEEKTRSSNTEDTGSLWEKDVDAAYERLGPDEKRSLKSQGLFNEQILEQLFPER